MSSEVQVEDQTRVQVKDVNDVVLTIAHILIKEAFANSLVIKDMQNFIRAFYVYSDVFKAPLYAQLEKTNIRFFNPIGYVIVHIIDYDHDAILKYILDNGIIDINGIAGNLQFRCIKMLYDTGRFEEIKNTVFLKCVISMGYAINMNYDKTMKTLDFLIEHYLYPPFDIIGRLCAIRQVPDSDIINMIAKHKIPIDPIMFRKCYRRSIMDYYFETGDPAKVFEVYIEFVIGIDYIDLVLAKYKISKVAIGPRVYFRTMIHLLRKGYCKFDPESIRNIIVYARNNLAIEDFVLLYEHAVCPIEFIALLATIELPERRYIEIFGELSKKRPIERCQDCQKI
jgi:hypothetical protein